MSIQLLDIFITRLFQRVVLDEMVDISIVLSLQSIA